MAVAARCDTCWGMDLILSSGYLAFARQAGFLLAVEEAGLEVGGLVGTSSGALAAALWAAGHSATDIRKTLCERSPWSMTRLSFAPWRGLLSMEPGVERLRELLPERFEDLPIPLAVGVCDAQGHARLLHTGPLAESVVASCSVPWLFTPGRVDGVSYVDGGAADRTGVAGWRSWRPGRRGVLHLVERTRGRATTDLLDDLTIVRSERSGASLWNLGPYEEQCEETRIRAATVLEGMSLQREDS